ncbi:MAG: 4Fe-4S dicluster domain-containing protein [Anaerovoracaceae bacterium]|jgi:adenylylsulfate reductase subunit B
MPPIINREKCNGCSICTQICTTDAFGPNEKGQVPTVQYPEECWHCRACVMDCPQGAIDLRYPLQLTLSFKEVEGGHDND